MRCLPDGFSLADHFYLTSAKLWVFYMQLSKAADKTSPRLSSVRTDDDVSPRSRAVIDADTKALGDKLKIAEQRNSEYRNQVQGLKTEIKMAQKVWM